MAIIHAREALQKAMEVRKSELYEAFEDINDSILNAVAVGKIKTDIYLDTVCTVCELTYDEDFLEQILDALVRCGYRVIAHHESRVLEVYWDRLFA